MSDVEDERFYDLLHELADDPDGETARRDFSLKIDAISVTVDPGAQQLLLKTSFATIKDIGTKFRVRLWSFSPLHRSDKGPRVDVQEGEVNITASDTISHLHKDSRGLVLQGMPAMSFYNVSSTDIKKEMGACSPSQNERSHV